MATVAYWAGFGCLIAAALCLLVFPALAVFRSTRRAAAYGYVACSFVFGGSLWIMCAVTVWGAWGTFWLVVGVFILGVGVFPMALIIFGLSSQWYLFAEVLLIGAIALSVRMLGIWLAEKS